jgi:UTP-glucose-1-phosphate uridylyltransferase
MSESEKTPTSNQDGVSKSKFSVKKIAEVKEEIIRINRCRSDLYLYGYINDTVNQKIHGKLKKLVEKYQINISRE